MTARRQIEAAFADPGERPRRAKPIPADIRGRIAFEMPDLADDEILVLVPRSRINEDKLEVLGWRAWLPISPVSVAEALDVHRTYRPFLPTGEVEDDEVDTAAEIARRIARPFR